MMPPIESIEYAALCCLTSLTILLMLAFIVVRGGELDGR